MTNTELPEYVYTSDLSHLLNLTKISEIRAKPGGLTPSRTWGSGATTTGRRENLHSPIHSQFWLPNLRECHNKPGRWLRCEPAKIQGTVHTISSTIIEWQQSSLLMVGRCNGPRLVLHLKRSEQFKMQVKAHLKYT